MSRVLSKSLLSLGRLQGIIVLLRDHVEMSVEMRKIVNYNEIAMTRCTSATQRSISYGLPPAITLGALTIYFIENTAHSPL